MTTPFTPPFGWQPAPQWAKDAKDADLAAEKRQSKK